MQDSSSDKRVGDYSNKQKKLHNTHAVEQCDLKMIIKAHQNIFYLCWQ